MRVAVFLNNFSLGGTEKAACRWALGLKARGHQVLILALKEGPRRAEFEGHGLPVQVVESSASAIARALGDSGTEVVHAHAPGFPHEGDVLGAALASLSGIPVVQTNIFGRLENAPEEAWTDFRLFISWTSCVQAARRSFRRLDEAFFRRASVAVYPLDPLEPVAATEVRAFRARHGVADNEVLFGRLSRPEPNKWLDLPLQAFRLALQRNRSLKLLLREPPPQVAETLRRSADKQHFVILPVTSEAGELRLTMSALDAVLHTSSIGESFGYGIAEPMNLGKPVVTHSTPWADQAQIELVRPGECGFTASTPASMAEAMVRLAGDAELRKQMGLRAQEHIRRLANTATSTTRLEALLRAAVEGRENPHAAEDLEQAKQAATYLDAHQFGRTFGEQAALRPIYWRVRFHELRRFLRVKLRHRNRECARP